MSTDPYRYFRSEAREIVERLGQGVLELEKGEPPAELTSGMFRLAHTLKGAARVVKQAEIADLSHAIEDLLAPLREKGRSLQREAIDQILVVLDEISTRVAGLGVASEPDPAKKADNRTEPRTAAPPTELRTIRADVSDLDGLLDNLTELSTRVGAVRRTLGVLDRARHVAQLLAEHASAPRLREAGVGATAVSRTAVLADELRGSLASLERDLTQSVDDLARELRQVKGAAEQLRLFPADVLFAALKRTARDVADHQGVLADFEAKGGDIRLDGHMLNAMQPALVQLVRNAIVHGIEPANERKTQGKPARGRVTLEVSIEGKHAIFRCEDDGHGINTAAVRKMAEARGLLPSEARALSDDAVFELLLKGGFSTSDNVTQVSGRGVGLDMVRAATERLGGVVSVRSRPAKGTVFHIALPVSLSSVDALLLETPTAVAAIPIAAVLKSVRVTSHELTRASNGLALVHEDQVVPFAPLPDLLGRTEPVSLNETWSAVIVRSGASLAAVGATRLISAETIVVRPLPPATPAAAFVLGAALDTDGVPQLVLDPHELVRAVANLHPTSGLTTAEPRAPILVIDDSMTTRMLEQNILQSAGYDVDVAASAEEGMELAKRNRYSLFLVDVEMPGMDGFTFMEKTRADPVLHKIPGILVTSRDAPRDRRRGEEAGASAYIIKGEFDQAEFLRIIRTLLT